MKSVDKVNLPDGEYTGTMVGNYAQVNGVPFKTEAGINTNIPQPVKVIIKDGWASVSFTGSYGSDGSGALAIPVYFVGMLLLMFLVGIFYAWKVKGSKWNYLLYGFVGAVAGGTIGYGVEKFLNARALSKQNERNNRFMQNTPPAPVWKGSLKNS